MNRKRLALIGIIAATIGGLVSLQLYRSMEKKIASGRQGDVDVLVAANDIVKDAKIDESNLKIVRYPADFLPSDTLHTPGSALGRVAVLPIAKGEFVLPDKLAVQGADPLSARIPAGMRAIPLPISESESGSVKPLDRVDILFTGNVAGSGDPQTTTVLADAKVLAVGPRVVTVLGSPEDVEKLTLASHEGRINLSIRNGTDTAQDKPHAITKTNLDGVPSTEQPKIVKVRQVPVGQDAAPHSYDIEIINGTHSETHKFKESKPVETPPRPPAGPVEY
jgi:pilus assembly protein CpaB